MPDPNVTRKKSARRQLLAVVSTISLGLGPIVVEGGGLGVPLASAQPAVGTLPGTPSYGSNTWDVNITVGQYGGVQSLNAIKLHADPDASGQFSNS